MQPTAQSVGKRQCKERSPEGAKELSPNIFFIHADTVLREKGAEFILKRILLVMFFLLRDVFRHGRHIRLADAEDSVSSLPREIGTTFANPA